MKFLRLSSPLQHFTRSLFLWQNHNVLYDVTENKVNTLCSIASVNTKLQKTTVFSKTLNNYNASQHFIQNGLTDHLSATKLIFEDIIMVKAL